MEGKDAPCVVVQHKGPVLMRLKVATILVFDNPDAVIDTMRGPKTLIVKAIRTDLRKKNEARKKNERKKERRRKEEGKKKERKTKPERRKEKRRRKEEERK